MYTRLLLHVSVILVWTQKTYTQEVAAVVRALTVEDMCLEAQESCAKCIQAHPECGWCYDNRISPRSREPRCKRFNVNVTDAKCRREFIANPESEHNATRNEVFSIVTKETDVASEEVIQLRPQALKVRLRKGQSEKVNITFRRVVDYPLDLYYVMDLSYSMRDDLEELQTLGSSLVESIRNFTNNVRLGFGTFVDKVMLPYASTIPGQLENPCQNLEGGNCAPVFGFRHQLPVTGNGSAFIDAVRATSISGNIDTPEGGFDALMQIAVCQEKIAWRPEALRVILFTSDASPHIAMDGKLAAILEVNDMECHLERGVNRYLPDAIVYANSKIMDYPSIGQLKKAFDDNKIQTVFAVTEEVFPLYKDLPSLLDNSFVDILNNDSSNVISVISTSYNALRTKIQLTEPSVPSNIEMSYRVLCPGTSTWIENLLECDNASIGDEVVFQFELMSTDCPDDSTQRDVISISSSTIRDVVELNIEYICDCDCIDNITTNSSMCSYSGSLQCGICSCFEGFVGLQCQCDEPTNGIPLEQNCTLEIPYRPGQPLCNNNGFCECGNCECVGDYYGEYCECRRSGCPADANENECGGEDQGTCENCFGNPVCICNETPGGWTLNPNTRICSCNEKRCRPDNASAEVPLCSGRGSCDCDTCSCDANYQGQLCERCVHPICTPINGTCEGEKIRECAECVYVQERLNRETVQACSSVCQDEGIVFNSVTSLPDCRACSSGQKTDGCSLCNRFSADQSIHIPQQCETNPFSNCIAKYEILWELETAEYWAYVQKHDQGIDCPTIDPLVIILPVVGGILLIGLILIIAWKIISTLRDKVEYEKFLEEQSNAKWATTQNTTYVSPQDRVQNPLFIGSE